MHQTNDHKISVAGLQIGMFVSRLDRPWLDTPFPLQGFEIKADHEIEQLITYCTEVYVDSTRGTAPHPQYIVMTPDPALRRSPELAAIKTRDWEISSDFDEEMEAAAESLEALGTNLSTVMADLKEGKELDLEVLADGINAMVDSILRNPDAYTCLIELKHRDRYTYQRALSTSVWSATFGRHLGLDRVGIRQLALGGLLLDVGKTRLPPALLENPNRLSSHEIAQLKQHVELGLEIIDERADVPNEVRNMVHSHHERYNGEGYPQGLQGAQIPLFGRLAGVVDTYDRLTTPRPYTECRSPHDAINMLYDCRDVEFQGELVEQFIQAVGIFPTGTLVELSTGEVGVIISLNGARRLRPRIMLILDKDKRPYRRFTELDLMEQEQDSDGNLLNVKKGLAPGAYGIDPDNLFL